MLLQSDTQLGRQSYYEVSVQRGPPLPPLQGAVDADVMVVGAGFAGLSAARPGATAGRPSSVMPAARRLSSSHWARRPRGRGRHRAGQGRVRAPFAVLAGNCTLGDHGPKIAPEIGARIMPVETYMIVTAPLDPTLCARLIPGNAAACDNNFVLDYFRFSADHRLLFGGRVSYSTGTPRNLKTVMRQRMTAVFPALRDTVVDFVWGGFVDISMNRPPDFGRIGGNVHYL